MGFFASSGILNRKGFFGGVTAAPAFSPTSIAGLKLWLKADAGVTEAGGVVTAWADQSGEGNDATEATLNPTLLISEKNGLNVIDFSNDKILTSDFAETTFTEQTFFCVFKYNSSSASTYGRLLSQFNIANGQDLSEYDFSLQDGYVPFLRNQGADELASYISTWGPTQTLVDGEWYIAVAKHNGTDAILFVNDSQETTGQSTLNAQISYIRICGSNVFGPNDFFNAKVAEVVVYETALTSQEITQIVNYLNTKWDIY